MILFLAQLYPFPSFSRRIRPALSRLVIVEPLSPLHLVRSHTSFACPPRIPPVVSSSHVCLPHHSPIGPPRQHASLPWTSYPSSPSSSPSPPAPADAPRPARATIYTRNSAREKPPP